ncbi:MAG: AraC family transcriptional regulator [Denitromonas halophila]|nr:MAG: AraC family transcriptional regulator [Denitromonas halophila]TVT75720.1 MAG: AraC family transcriptional regulator [Denitromonas halophila]
MHLIRIGAIGGVEALTRKFGGNPIELIQRIGLSPSQFRDPNTFISLAKMAELVELCSIECKNPLFGLSLGLRQNPGVLMDLLVTASQEKTIHEAIENFSNHLYLHATGVHLDLITTGSETRIQFHFEITTPLGIEHMVQVGAGQLINFISSMVRDTDRRHLSLCLRQGAPHHASIPDGQCPYPVIFSSTFDGALICASVANQPPHLDEEILSRHFKEYLSYLKARYPDNLLSQMKEVIGRLLPSGECSVDQVAATLDLSPRSLQRMLLQENTSYGLQLQAVRCAIAKQHLEHGLLPITELALNLGYSDISVFSRHFKRWTGASPRAWRNAVKTSRSHQG